MRVCPHFYHVGTGDNDWCLSRDSTHAGKQCNSHKDKSFVDDLIYFSSKIKDVYIDGDYSKLTTQKMILSGAMPADNTRTVNGLTGVYNVVRGKGVLPTGEGQSGIILQNNYRRYT